MPPPKLKKSKASSSSSSSGPSPLLAQVTSLESTLLSPASLSLNPLADLLHLASTCADPSVVHKAVYALGRVFARLVESGRVTERRAGEQDGADKEAKVREWARQRLAEFVRLCGGLMKDQEKDMRSAGFSNLLALLPVLSHSSSPSTSARPPSYSSPHLRSLVRFILFPTPSTRGGSTEFSIPEEELEDEDEVERLTSEDRGLDVEEDMVDLLGQAMEDKRDLRWGVYREASILLRPYLPPTSNPSPLSLASNLLLLLQTQQAPIPASQKLLEKQSLLMPGFAKSPFASSAIKGKPAFGEVKAVVEGGDWRDYFESDEEEDEEEDEPVGKGGKKGSAVRKGKGKKAAGSAKKGEGRASGMSVHQGVWSLESHRAGFTSAWMGLLSLPLDPSLARRILIVLHHQVLPNMTKGRAVRTADWLGEWVDRGGPLGLLALNGLFILIRDYNLDYPDFYDRLYAMLDRSVLHVKYRSRFFRLAETFLSSSHLPSTLIAAIIKRLGRLSLSAPPAAIIMVIPFVYNLLKLHPGCMVLIHRDTFGGTEPTLDTAAEAAKDPYDAATSNPLLSNALDSSLWELASHQKHYLPSVSSLAKIFNEVFTKPRYGMEDFLDHTFVTLFDTETKRKIRNDPALALTVPGAVFPVAVQASKKRKAVAVEDEVAKRDVVAEIWAF